MPRCLPLSALILLTLASLWAAAQEPATPPAPPVEESKPPSPAAPAAPADPKTELRKALDAYLDGRWLPRAEAEKATEDLVKRLTGAGCTIEEVEAMLRAGRVSYADGKAPGKMLRVEIQRGEEKTVHNLPLIDLSCEHVDYKTAFFLYVPKSCKPTQAAPLLLVGHGGNGAMSAEYATKATLGGIVPWLPVVEQKGMILAAPLSERGWGAIGNSILLSTISWVQRHLNLDPDRVYVTGHSMGGHLSWRSGIYLGDRWGAVSPMSGGYDYVADKQVFTLVNVPGYATFGEKEPYQINEFDKKIRQWMTEHQLDWKLVEKPGGHEIFADELPKIADFLLAHPRNPYRRRVYGIAASTVVYDNPEKNEKWSQQHTWNPDRPIQRSTFHWLRVEPVPKDAPKDKYPGRVWAENLGENRFRITSQTVRRLRIYLHPKMVDFAKPVEITANGQKVFEGKVEPNMKTMLELVREFDDRGRIYYAVVEVNVPTDADVPEPRGDAPAGG